MTIVVDSSGNPCSIEGSLDLFAIMNRWLWVFLMYQAWPHREAMYCLCIYDWLGVCMLCVCVTGWDRADGAGCVKERQWGEETCYFKEQPSFFTHLPCLLSLCQPTADCVCLSGCLNTQLMFGWHLVERHRLQHIEESLYIIGLSHLTRHQTFIQTVLRYCVSLHGCASVCAEHPDMMWWREGSFLDWGVCRGLLENVWAAALVGV